ncbi:sulfotransferase [Hyphobacterium sp. CCMP332]|nr:sulfotransferase [Hyphobacterium sp. CCMP332]
MQIGFQKCGTTSLYRWLRQHPALHFYNGKKDPQFFNREKDWKNKIDLYHSNFSDNSKLWSEASDQYSTFPEFRNTAKRLFEYNPDLKFVAVIRHPVDRSLSHYDFNKLRGGARGEDEEKVILNASKYITRSQYYLQLKQFRKYFPKDQIKIVLFDDFKTSPEKVLSSIFQFLDIEDISNSLNYNQSKSTVGEYHQKFKYKKLIASDGFKWLRKISPSGIRKSLKPVFYGKTDKKTTFSNQFKNVLWQLFEEDINSLEKEFDLDLSTWKNKYN